MSPTAYWQSAERERDFVSFKIEAGKSARSQRRTLAVRSRARVRDVAAGVRDERPEPALAVLTTRRLHRPELVRVALDLEAVQLVDREAAVGQKEGSVTAASMKEREADARDEPRERVDVVDKVGEELGRHVRPRDRDTAEQRAVGEGVRLAARGYEHREAELTR